MLYVTRHGQTDWNRIRRYQGATDIRMNETGREQARRVRDGLAHVRFDRVVSSPRNRAIETASIITGLPPDEIEISPALAEAELGDWEARYEEGIIAELGDAYFAWTEHAGLIPPPNGESLFHVMARLYEPLEAWLAEAVEKNVLIVAHQGTNAALLMLITGSVSKESAKAFRRNNSQVDVIDPATRSIVKTLVFE